MHNTFADVYYYHKNTDQHYDDVSLELLLLLLSLGISSIFRWTVHLGDCNLLKWATFWRNITYWCTGCMSIPHFYSEMNIRICS
jgi:hypothetical protein